MFLKTLVLAATLALSAGAVNARTILCSTDAGRAQGGWISDKYLFEFDLATGVATALDGVADYYEGGPVRADLGGSEDKKVTFSWLINAKSKSGQLTKMQYRASWFPSKNKLTVRGIPGAGYAGGFQASGTCEVKK
jgi:hypothetical protein